MMRKLGKSKGFTLVEMLACILTLLLICMLCTTGMNFAMKSYQESLFESDSQMLESTLNMYISDVLRHATSIEAEEDGRVTAFTNATYGIYEGTIVASERKDGTGGIFLLYTGEYGSGTLVVGEEAYAKTLYIEGFTINYDSTTGIFTGGYTIKSSALSDVERECTFTCRTIAN